MTCAFCRMLQRHYDARVRWSSPSSANPPISTDEVTLLWHLWMLDWARGRLQALPKPGCT